MGTLALRRIDPVRESLPARLRTTQLRMVEAIVSGEGLSRVTEIASDALDGMGVVIVLPEHEIAVGTPAPTAASLDGLRRYASGPGGGCERPDELAIDVPIWSGGNRIGVVCVVGTDADASLPEALEFLHLVTVAALTEVGLRHARQEVETNLRGAFFEELRSGRAVDPRELVTRAGRLGCDLSHGAVVLCVELSTPRPRHVIALISGELPGALAEGLDGRIYAVLPAPPGSEGRRQVLRAAHQLGVRLERHGTVGVSGFYRDPGELPRAVEEAELVLGVLGHVDPCLAEAISGGTYRLLLRMLASHPHDVRAFYEETVAPLVRHDERHGTELVHTLETYFESNCNANATAARAFAHRHTVSDRLERVKSLTGLDTTCSEDRERLSLGLKAWHLLAAGPGSRAAAAPGGETLGPPGGRFQRTPVAAASA